MLRRIPLLARDACDAIHDRVFELERHWTQRHHELPSFTLGATAYLDVPAGGIPQYLRTKSGGNKILERNFTELYGALARALSAELGAPAFLTDRFALPGFHIYGHHPELARVEPTIHFDLQDLDLDLDPGRPEDARCSFTLPIRIPAQGAGLHIWSLWHREVRDLPHEEAVALAASRERTYHAYQTGELFLHSGDQLHQIANDVRSEEGEVRLTLQGHGLKTARGWELYW